MIQESKRRMRINPVKTCELRHLEVEPGLVPCCMTIHPHWKPMNHISSMRDYAQIDKIVKYLVATNTLWCF